MHPVLIAVLLLFSTVQTGVPDLTGTWRLDRDLSTADLSWIKTNILVVDQYDDEVRFDFFLDDRRLGTEIFVTDGEERPRYTTRLERAFAKARWEKGNLIVITRSFLDAYGYQSYSQTDRWELSPDGKTLANKSSDGKMILYYKQPSSEPVDGDLPR